MLENRNDKLCDPSGEGAVDIDDSVDVGVGGGVEFLWNLCEDADVVDKHGDVDACELLRQTVITIIIDRRCIGNDDLRLDGEGRSDLFGCICSLFLVSGEKNDVESSSSKLLTESISNPIGCTSDESPDLLFLLFLFRLIRCQVYSTKKAGVNPIQKIVSLIEKNHSSNHSQQHLHSSTLILLSTHFFSFFLSFFLFFYI